ncbi:hypothetical protein [Paenibacillus glycanilyticus]|uniref:hypothetical protein n=1 Tax=Paenibacillus glycanilyticus TaxID=126569 RepID=UPI0024E16F5A|nr:hypothetical protein [Paenibacillus glycanilyticus]
MSCRTSNLVEILASLAIGEQITTVNAVTIELTNAIWAGFFEGNAKFLDAGVPVYIPVSKIQYINR